MYFQLKIKCSSWLQSSGTLNRDSKAIKKEKNAGANIPKCATNSRNMDPPNSNGCDGKCGMLHLNILGGSLNLKLLETIGAKLA